MPPVPRPADVFESLSIVIPACNAEAHVASTLDAAQSWLEASGVPHEVIVVDDGSRDRTAELIERRGRGVILLRNESNRGKGYAVRRGMSAARHAWALFMDADHSTHIRHLEQFAPLAGRADVVIGSRRVPGARIVRPQHRLRQALGRTFPYLVQLVALRDIRDTQCGFKLFRRAAAEAIFSRQRVDRFAFDVEVLLLARRLGLRIVEAPVDWDNPTDSTLRIGVDTWVMLYDLVRTVCRLRP
jgi:dolichyl-phosphate beta-glucosyltransferase